MSRQGATLQEFNKELVKSIENLKRKRSELQEIINEEEAKRTTVHKEIERLSEKLEVMNVKLSRKLSVRNEYDRTIEETEAAYTKIVESSHVLLNMIQRESENLTDLDLQDKEHYSSVSSNSS